MLGTSLGEMRLGRLRAVIGIHLPYHLFQVSTADNDAVLLAIDAVSGEMDLYRFDEMPAITDHAPAVERRIPVALSVEVARRRLSDRTLRMIFLKGFFRLRHPKIDCVYVGEILLPYWIGLFERRDRVKLEVIDACRGQFEGEKVREVVRQSLERFSSTLAQPAVERATVDRKSPA